MCRKNIDQIHVIFSLSVWLQCALLYLSGSLELVCSWTAPKCESPQVISLAYPNVSTCSGNYFWKTLDCHIASTVRAFDLIPNLRARPEYQLSSGNKYINVILCDSHQHCLDIDTTQSFLDNHSVSQLIAIKKQIYDMDLVVILSTDVLPYGRTHLDGYLTKKLWMFALLFVDIVHYSTTFEVF